MEQQTDSYIKSRKLIRYTLRMDKAYSSFFYFTMESNENIAFYSTLPFNRGQVFRDIVVHTTPELEDHLTNIINHCNKDNKITILEHTVVNG